jgi:glyoxylase I family protein
MLAHFTLATPDVDRFARFIERTFGFPVKPSPPDSPVKVAWFDIGQGQEMHLLQVEGYQPSRFEGEFGRHVALRYPAAEFASLRSRLVDAGATLIDAQRPTPFARFFVREPVYGYVFEVVEAASHFDQ